MRIDVRVPELADEDGDPIVVGYWFVREGQRVLVGEELVEVMCGKTVFTVASPASGAVARILAENEDVVHVGDRLAMIERADPGDLMDEPE